MASYSDKLKDPRWQKKRLKILERDKWTCRLYQRDDKTLHIHHEKYKGNPWDIEDEYLKTVCCFCHEIIEENKKREFSTIHTEFTSNDNGDEFYYAYIFIKDIGYAVGIYDVNDGNILNNTCLISKSAIQRMGSILNSL